MAKQTDKNGNTYDYFRLVFNQGMVEQNLLKQIQDEAKENFVKPGTMIKILLHKYFVKKGDE